MSLRYLIFYVSKEKILSMNSYSYVTTVTKRGAHKKYFYNIRVVYISSNIQPLIKVYFFFYHFVY